MSNFIKVLPENVANQIAAGEVIQRPSSAVKELLENAVDAKATKINLVVKDAGKTLIQVIDNGNGMNQKDAELCFLRHATSKIIQSDDLFNISTKGFRGEALASIAAIAQVVLKTKTKECTLGHQLKIEGSKIKSKEQVTCAIGSNFSMKNLFFNVPARRNFLKSDAVETKHIIDEFQRIALAHTEIHFTMHNNEQLVFDLPVSPLRQRIINVFGKRYNERLVPIQENTSITDISGFIVKPEHCKRTRGEQYFFVNNRFIKSPYLNHAINQAYSELIGKDQFPSYFIFLSVPTNTLDINIHPTKTEIKFQDERSIYAIVRSTVKSSLGKYSISPSLDFDQENSFNPSPLLPGQTIVPPSIKINPNYNPFRPEKTQPEAIENTIKILEDSSKEFSNHKELSNAKHVQQNWSGILESTLSDSFFQLEKKYIVTKIKKSLCIIDQYRAHQHVLYKQFLANMEEKKAATQKLLFPVSVELPVSDYQLSMDLLPNMKAIGFDIDDFGNKTLVINGIPEAAQENDSKLLLERFIEEFKQSAGILTNENEKFAWSFASSSAIRGGRELSNVEMESLINDLLTYDLPQTNAKGKRIFYRLDSTQINQLFSKK